ncbi:MAG: glutamate synthase [bacterium]|nr:glutamate synthase [Planctomycetota bacterium]HIL51438.1 glutamate synthase [Planctomycetota bacterium]
MVELRPHPFGALVRRMLREARQAEQIFDTSFKRCFFGAPTGIDLSVGFHGLRASTPLGPAAGPHSQMAQNIVLSWLAGCRVMELKTVQIEDQLEIPRPCIDMATVGYNIEWSQELRLGESLEEYVKASMLIEILRASGVLPLGAQGEVGTQDGADQEGGLIFDMSVGYDLAGIKSRPVQDFIAGMQDAGDLVARLREELLAPELADVLEDHPIIREIDFTSRISNTLTLSTFHGCPPHEIEGIVEYLMRECGLHVIVKLNPTLLGPERVSELLEDELGYSDLRVPPGAFEADTTWDDMLPLVERLAALAQELGLGFGVKFSNTLIVENRRDFFPAQEKTAYLSGAPLHILAMDLVARFRAHFGSRFPISFSAGIERKNFPDAVALGLVPVTVCTDFLRPGGYGRGKGYFDELLLRMEELGARCIDDYVIRAAGHGKLALERAAVRCEARPETLRASLKALAAGTGLGTAAGADLHREWAREAALLNTQGYLARALASGRYLAENNKKGPKKIGSQLELFDCIACDKCVPVCPNNANFVFELPRLEAPRTSLHLEGLTWVSQTDGLLVIEKQRQFGSFADFCNECGNCDVFCPEDGGPYKIKPRIFGSEADWRLFKDYDGFCFPPGERAGEILGRIDGADFGLSGEGARTHFQGPGFAVVLDPQRPLDTISGDCEAGQEVDLCILHILTWVRLGLQSSHELPSTRDQTRAPHGAPGATWCGWGS